MINLEETNVKYLIMKREGEIGYLRDKKNIKKEFA